VPKDLKCISASGNVDDSRVSAKENARAHGAAAHIGYVEAKRDEKRI
jgi:hypothetical protein